MFFLNGPTSFYLSLSFRTHITSFTANECEICPSSKRWRELNSRPLEYESPPITTRPGLLPWCCVTLWSLLCASLFYVLRQERLQIPFYSQTLFRIASKTADIKTGYAYLWHQMFKWKSINIIAEKIFYQQKFLFRLIRTTLQICCRPLKHSWPVRTFSNILQRPVTS